MSEHITAAFDEDLNELNTNIARLGTMAAAQFSAAAAILKTRNAENIEAIITKDRELDALEITINERAIEIIALRAPMADDLRRIIASLKVAAILERIGDYAKNIAKRMRVLLETDMAEFHASNLETMAQLVHHMLADVLDAYMKRTVNLAMEVRARDIDVDQMHTNLFQDLLAGMAQAPQDVAACAHLLFIAKNIERIGDYATNIAEQVYFLEYGALPEDERPKADASSETMLET